MLAFIAEALQRHIETDPSLQAATAGLRRSGLSLVVRLELTAGQASPVKLLINARPSGVPQWSLEDREILQALGIASDPDGPERRDQAKPGRR